MSSSVTSSPSSSSSSHEPRRRIQKKIKRSNRRNFRSRSEKNSPMPSLNFQQTELQNQHLNETTFSDRASPTINISSKPYIGVSTETIRCIWDQINDSDLEISADVLPVIAEDATYKLWELANNLKIFAHNSGGKLTADIVTEVLKDSDVPPVLGTRSACTDWKVLDYDGTCYFHEDQIINLREEYLKEVNVVQPGPITIDCEWITDPPDSEELTNLANSIILAITLGDNIAYDYAIHTVLINPFIGCILPSLMQKSLEFLSFGCPHECLERLLPFFKSLAHNPHAGGVSDDETNYHLCHVFVSLLLEPMNIATSLASVESVRKQNRDRLKHFFIKQEVIDDGYDDGRANEEEEMPPKMVINPVAIKQEILDEATSNYTDVIFQNIKTEPYDAGYQVYDPTPIIKTEPEPCLPESGNLHEEVEPSTGKETFSAFETKTCDGRFVEDVCTVIGLFANRWGYFEHELTYLLSKRLEIFFFCVERNYWEGNSWSVGESIWLWRYVQVLAALGESAFRELTQYFDWIPTRELPEWLTPYLNYATIFVRGKRDYFFYEFMQEFCGDGLIPFQSYYSKTIEKIQKRYAQRLQRHIENEPPLTIIPKTGIETLTKASKKPGRPARKKITLDKMFPDLSEITPKSNQIGFKFAGCRPVNIKPKMKFTITEEIVQDEESLQRFNKQVVVCKKKILKPMYINSYGNRYQPICDYRMLSI